MEFIRGLTVFIVFLFYSFPGAAQPMTVEEVLQQLIDNYGGAENLRKLDTFIQHWEFTTIMGNKRGTDKRTVRMPDQLMVELTYPHKTEIRILDRDSAFYIFNDNEPKLAHKAQRDAMRLQLMRLYSPLILREKIKNIKLTNNSDHCALTLLEHGVRADYLVSKELWRIEKVSGSLVINGDEMQFLTEYSKFENVDGVLVHRRENKFVGDLNTAVLELKKITLSPDIEERVFGKAY